MLLKAHAVGFGIAETVLLYALFNATCVLAAPLAGKLGDRIGRRRIGRRHIVLLGYALYGLLNLGLMFADSRPRIIALFAIYGIFHAIEDSQTKAFIADLEPQRRATAHCIGNFVTARCACRAIAHRGLADSGTLWSIRASPYMCLGARTLNRNCC